MCLGVEDWTITVTEGPMVHGFRGPASYFNLPDDPYMATCVPMKDWRIFCRMLQRNGALVAKIEKGVTQLSEKMAMIVMGGCAGIGLFLILMASN